MNAKACSVVELYGTLDPVTRDWTDGLLSNIFRDINKPTEKKERKYILFDSDVDALWVENMNSVMDDNKLLTLANGERIRLQAHCALLFEVCLRPFLNLTPFLLRNLFYENEYNTNQQRRSGLVLSILGNPSDKSEWLV